MRIAIVGCGVAGSVLATLLAHHPSLDIVGFEKASPGEHAEAGTGLNVGPNAMKALRLAAPALLDCIRAASYPWQRWTVSTTDGAPIFDFPLSELAEDDGIRIRWAELYRTLRAPLDGRIRYGIQVTDVVPDDPDARHYSVRYTDAQGASHTESGFDLVVAGDGRYSALRTRFGGDWTPRHLGVVIYRLLVPDTSAGLMGDYRWWFNGPNRLLAFRVPDDQVYIAGTFPIAAGAPIPAQAQQPEAFARHYVPAGGESCPEVAWMVATLAAHAGQIHWARLQESPMLFRDPGGRVLFLGDAAHGMVPTLGQGATQAIEDACTAAAQVLSHVARHGTSAVDDVPALTQSVAQVRTERVRWVMDFSWDATAALLEGADAVAQMARLRNAPYRARFRRLWSDIDV